MKNHMKTILISKIFIINVKNHSNKTTPINRILIYKPIILIKYNRM